MDRKGKLYNDRGSRMKQGAPAGVTHTHTHHVWQMWHKHPPTTVSDQSNFRENGQPQSEQTPKGRNGTLPKKRASARDEPQDCKQGTTMLPTYPSRHMTVKVGMMVIYSLVAWQNEGKPIHLHLFRGCAYGMRFKIVQLSNRIRQVILMQGIQVNKTCLYIDFKLQIRFISGKSATAGMFLNLCIFDGKPQSPTIRSSKPNRWTEYVKIMML